jgi:uracil-DNA glycosylase family 4
LPASDHNAPDPVSLLLLLQQTRNLLACHLALGQNSYPATPKLRQFAAAQVLAPFSALAVPHHQQVPEELPIPVKKQVSGPQASVLSLPEIAQQLAHCQRCLSASAPVPGQSSAAPVLMVVCGRSFGEVMNQSMILGQGQAEDELFWRMMAAIGLNRETVYITNVVKCRPQEILDGERNCMFWLEQELRMLQPRLICAMGETAAQVLIGKTSPLFRLRGKFHPCCLPGASQAQVLATYHPHFLLQQPDMKKAAWLDLQNVQSYLSSQ